MFGCCLAYCLVWWVVCLLDCWCLCFNYFALGCLVGLFMFVVWFLVFCCFLGGLFRIDYVQLVIGGMLR